MTKTNRYFYLHGKIDQLQIMGNKIDGKIVFYLSGGEQVEFEDVVKEFKGEQDEIVRSLNSTHEKILNL